MDQLALILFVACLYGSLWQTDAQEAPEKRGAVQEGVAATVNGETLTWKWIRDGLGSLKPEQMTPALLQARRQELVGLMLIRQFAERKHLAVSESEVDEAVDRDRKGYGSVEEYRKTIYLRYGSASKYRETWQWTLLRGKALDHALATQDSDPDLKDAGFSPATPPVDALRRYFDTHEEEFKAADTVSFVRIGMKFAGPGGEAEKRAIGESILRRLEKGADFFMVSHFYSDVRWSKDFRNRGVSRADLAEHYTPETIAYLFDGMKEGDTSPLVKDGATLNIFKIEQRLKVGVRTFEEAKGAIRATLEAGIREENQKKLVRALRRSGQIEPADVFEER